VRIRDALRLAGVAQHLAYGLCVATLLYPLLSPASRRRLQQRWSRRLLAILGVRLEVSGAAALHGLLVANHISWLDVFVISSIAPATFVCKSEVRRWPLIGLLCARTGTVFLERGSRSAARQVNRTLAGKLRNGEPVVVFPEGTTSAGASLLAFRAALLQSAIDAETHVQPLALRYRDGQGMTAVAAAYCGETSFWQSLRAIASAPEITASIDILEKLPSAAQTRRNLCEQAHAVIGSRLIQSAPGYFGPAQIMATG